MNTFNYSTEILDAITLLRDAGFAVCAFDPEELDGINPERVEGKMCVAGWDAIEYLKGEE